MLAQTTTIPASTQWGIAGILFAVFATSVYIILRILRTYERSIRNTISPYERRMTIQEHENLQLKRENRVCNRRLAMVVTEIMSKGIEISAEAWTRAEAEEPPVPPLVLEDDEDAE